ncbi:hypothetical Protein YC6258_02602 [Gynuella sunshinyii YC6258]|uniref:Uncharacterized protein n=1 Tax=Gynuella sunshinyii YC6258 TaxID=1445510 RepID=A0A0C5V5B5_9GAMM|nr:hypothetical Protein YC6258_02602 [Gynuella sunshinyii YC6258]
MESPLVSTGELSTSAFDNITKADQTDKIISIVSFSLRSI